MTKGDLLIGRLTRIDKKLDLVLEQTERQQKVHQKIRKRIIDFLNNGKGIRHEGEAEMAVDLLEWTYNQLNEEERSHTTPTQSAELSNQKTDS